MELNILDKFNIIPRNIYSIFSTRNNSIRKFFYKPKFSSLFKRLFYVFNKINKIKVSDLLNTIDSTIIPEKQAKFINQKDWDSNKVTTRIINK